MTDLEQQLRSYFEAIEPRTDADLTTPVIDVTDTKEPTMNPRTWLLAAAAALVLLVGAAIFRSGDDTVVETLDTPITTESTTTEPPTEAGEPNAEVEAEPSTTELTAEAVTATAEGVMDAWLSLDPTQLEVLDLPQGTEERLIYWQSINDVLNLELLTRSPCELTSETTARCSYTFTDDLIEAVGAEEIDGVSWVIVVNAETGDPVSVRGSESLPKPNYFAAIFATEETHPEIWDGVCRAWPEVPDPAPAPGACELALLEIFRTG